MRSPSFPVFISPTPPPIILPRLSGSENLGLEGAVCPNFKNFTEKKIKAQSVYGATQLGLVVSLLIGAYSFPVAAVANHLIWVV